MFQHTAARRRLVVNWGNFEIAEIVSTHSRPKAAGWAARTVSTTVRRFNTQPPEGGWLPEADKNPTPYVFQHTAARRRLGRKS